MLGNSLRALALLGALLASAGSATLIKGRSQDVTITTSPPGAAVFVDDRPVGTSPLKLELAHRPHSVSATMAGYAPGFVQLTTSFSGWSLALPPFSVLIDALTGSISTLDQDKVVIELGPAGGPGSQPGQTQQPPQTEPAGVPERHPH